MKRGPRRFTAMTSQWTYSEAIGWIAANDNPGDREPAKVLAGYLTVGLVADMFGLSPKTVAADVVIARGDK